MICSFSEKFDRTRIRSMSLERTKPRMCSLSVVMMARSPTENALCELRIANIFCRPEKIAPCTEIWIGTFSGILPIEFGTVYPTAVFCFGWIITICVVIDSADFIAKVDEGNAANEEEDTVNEQYPANGEVNILV